MAGRAVARYAAEHPELAAEFEQLALGRAARGLGRGLPGVDAGRRAARHPAGLRARAPGDRGRGAQPGGRLRRPRRQHRHHAQAGRHASAPRRSGAPVPLGRAGARDGRRSSTGSRAHGGLRPFGSTFLVFSDYMKPAIRLAAIMRLPVIYIGTHDSIGLGEDGPTHQPIEHLAMLRAIPNLVVLRPADATETVEAWRVAMARHDGPTDAGAHPPEAAGARSRRRWGRPRASRRGAYVLLDPPGGEPQAILIATGSEVHVAAGGGAAAPGRPGAGAGGLDAVVGAVRGAAGGVPGRGAAAGGARAPGDRGGVAVRLAPLDHRRRRDARRWTASAPRRPGERLFQEFKFTPERAAEMVRALLAQRHAPGRSEGA